MQSNFKKHHSNSIVISLGDPAGIGIEVTLKALGSNKLPKDLKPILIGCRKSVELIHSQLKNQSIKLIPDLKDLEIVDIPLKGYLEPGKPTKESGDASFHWLTRATELIKNGRADALVTAPIAKHNWHLAGHKYPGQTERLAQLSNVDNGSMLFTAVSPHNGWRLNTLLATTHIPLAKVSKALNPNLINAKLDVLMGFCKKFNKYPKIFVAGLNPHSGEQGQLGEEEIKWIEPVLQKWAKQHPEVILKGPIPPDTCWISSAAAWNGKTKETGPDGILALYHDQGLIPIKIIAFEDAVNTTLGLKFIRTSPDHGTGFDIAGKGCANENSMIAAINTAWQLK